MTAPVSVLVAAEAMRRFVESFNAPSAFDLTATMKTTDTQKEIETVTTEAQLLDVIAAAQEKLSAIRRLPQEEPHSDTDALAYRFVTKPTRRNAQGRTFTYLVLRIPGANGYASWYVTARNGTFSRNPMTWDQLMEFMSSSGVTAFESLYTRDEWVELTGEDGAEQDGNNSILPSYS